MKTMALRLDDELHTQLNVLAQLSGGSITTIIRDAINAYLAAKRDDPELSAKADTILADIEKAARNQRDAITALLNSTTSADHADGTKSPARTRKSS